MSKTKFPRLVQYGDFVPECGKLALRDNEGIIHGYLRMNSWNDTGDCHVRTFVNEHGHHCSVCMSFQFWQVGESLFERCLAWVPEIVYCEGYEPPVETVVSPIKASSFQRPDEFPTQALTTKHGDYR